MCTAGHVQRLKPSKALFIAQKVATEMMLDEQYRSERNMEHKKFRSLQLAARRTATHLLLPGDATRETRDLLLLRCNWCGVSDSLSSVKSVSVNW